jgi:hypothetical protein
VPPKIIVLNERHLFPQSAPRCTPSSFLYVLFDFCCYLAPFLLLTMMDDSDGNGSRILENTKLMLRKLNGSRLVQARMRRNAAVAVENLKFKLDPKLVGKRYGIYNVKNGALADEATEEGKLFRSTLVITMFCLEITEYKNVCESAAEPDEIEQAENEGRADQTKLVRDKIQLKQAKKALTLIQIEPATPRLLSELFYSRNVESVGFLR